MRIFLAWLCGCLRWCAQALRRRLHVSPSIDGGSHHTLTFTGDVHRVIGLLEDFPGPHDVVGHLVGDIQALSTIMDAGLGRSAPKASDLAAAELALTSKRAATLRIAYEKCKAMSDGRAVVEGIMKRSAADEVADAKLKDAIKILTDTRMPRETVTSDTNSEYITLSSLMHVFDNVAFQSLCESLQAVIEATDMWSAIRKEEMSDQVAEWAGHVINFMTTVDKALWVHLLSTCKEMDVWSLTSQVSDQEVSHALAESLAGAEVALVAAGFNEAEHAASFATLYRGARLIAEHGFPKPRCSYGGRVQVCAPSSCGPAGDGVVSPARRCESHPDPHCAGAPRRLGGLCRQGRVGYEFVHPLVSEVHQLGEA